MGSQVSLASKVVHAPSSGASAAVQCAQSTLDGQSGPRSIGAPCSGVSSSCSRAVVPSRSSGSRQWPAMPSVGVPCGSTSGVPSVGPSPWRLELELAPIHCRGLSQQRLKTLARRQSDSRAAPCLSHTRLLLRLRPAPCRAHARPRLPFLVHSLIPKLYFFPFFLPATPSNDTLF